MNTMQFHGTVLILAGVLLACSGAVLRADNNAPAANGPACNITETTVAKSDGLDVVNNSLHVTDDGNHLVFVVRRGGRQAMVLDGVVGKAFDGEISGLYFSNDGTHVFYYLKHDKKERVVVDDIVSDEYDDVTLSFSPDSKRWAYIGRRGTEDVLVTNEGEARRWNARMDKYGFPPISNGWRIVPTPSG